jgi:aspartyl-tRNA(Asn)/glutamyl-tRNA(Gln) amidotransferase subunit B
MGELVDLVTTGRITGTRSPCLVDVIRHWLIQLIGTSGKALLRHMLSQRNSSMPSDVAEQLQLYSSAAPDSELESLCAEAMDALPDEVRAMRRGSTNVVNKLVGRVMKSSRGRADATAVRAMLEKMILG